MSFTDGIRARACPRLSPAAESTSDVVPTTDAECKLNKPVACASKHLVRRSRGQSSTLVANRERVNVRFDRSVHLPVFSTNNDSFKRT